MKTLDRNRLVKTFRGLLGLSLLLQVLGCWELVVIALEFQISSRSWKWMSLFGFAGLLVLATLGLLLLTWRPAVLGRLFSWAERALHLDALRPLAASAIVFCALLLPAVALAPLSSPFSRLQGAFFVRTYLFWMAVVVGAFFLQQRKPGHSFAKSLAVVVVTYGAVYRVAAFLPEISGDPFSLGWSEASRFYYASLFFAEKVYGLPFNPSVLHPTRYMLQSLPFLIDTLPLWVHRAWQVFLWLATNAAAAWVLTGRLQRRGRLPARPMVFALWVFLFLFQGPIWYHLVVILIIVLWGTETRRFWKTLLVVGAASVWAGMSRVNWIPFPAALAAMLYLLEVPVSKRPLERYLAPPLAWGVAGAVLGLLAQWAYAVLSGNALDQFTSSFTSDLLWYRLFPSATYPLGILPGILLVLLPPVWAVLQVRAGRWESFEPVRLLGILGILLVFFAGGLVVSVKIGGGSNLHNLDGFIALLLVAATYLTFVDIPPQRQVSQLAAGVAIAVPVAFALAVGGPLQRYDPLAVRADLIALAEVVEAAAAQGDEVLFIAERHLLSLGQIENIPLVEDYEKVFLMEMAMAGNPEYLGRFEEELADRRFALIITDTVNYDLQTRANAFGEENNVWDAHVNYPLLCYYQPLFRLQTQNVQVLEPRPQPACP